MMAGPYLILIIPEAVLNGNPDTGFLLSLFGLAVAGSLTVETLLLPAWPGGNWRERFAAAAGTRGSGFALARTVAGISIVGDVTTALLGGGTIFTQVTGETSSSSIVQIASLVSSWRYLAFGLLIASLLGGRIPRRSAYAWMTALVLVQVAITVLTARTNPLFSYVTFAAVIGLVFGVFKVRYIVIAIVAVLIIWPTIFSVRNQIRESGGVPVSQSTTAEDRLRFDLQVTRAHDYVVPADIGEPGALTFVRYAVVPRVLDPGRPAFSTGHLINIYLGGGDTSAFTFLPLGTIYFLNGYLAIPIFYGAWALVVAVLLRARGGPRAGPAVHALPADRRPARLDEHLS